jgi:hypothetical protein
MMARAGNNRGDAGDAVTGCLVVVTLLVTFVFVAIAIMSRRDPSPYAADPRPRAVPTPVVRTPTPTEIDTGSGVSDDTIAQSGEDADVSTAVPSDEPETEVSTDEPELVSDVPSEEWTDSDTARYEQLHAYYLKQFRRPAAGTRMDLHLVKGGKITGSLVSYHEGGVGLDVGSGATVRIPMDQVGTRSKIRFDQDEFAVYYAKRQLSREIVTRHQRASVDPSHP